MRHLSLAFARTVVTKVTLSTLRSKEASFLFTMVCKMMTQA